ncbi:hypothetical protein [Streptomyces sp. NBC_00439]|uniref:DUF6881 domain-containing protein n=1 Tax=Streptomyces sp. NBC_00439 TaxID=2903650 RepID=UPI002255C892|nr:hypothetical protein [Streptomyces sp. NBC_00439]MCX5103467.1 hypothetical protein [Streptomyces sp. NBC_00439]
MSDTSRRDSDYGLLPVMETNIAYPLTHYTIGVHLGLKEFTENNVAEALRRTKAFFALYEEAGKPLIARQDGSPLLVQQIDETFIRRHFGQKMSFGTRTPDEFDEHLLNIRSSLTGIPRRSYRRITFLGLARPNQRPFRILQEIDDRYRSEARRVEIYTDGTLLWREDGYHGLGPAETEHTESEDVPGLGIINDRTNQHAESVPAAEFEALFQRAQGVTCGWIVDCEPSAYVQPSTAIYCEESRPEDKPFCGHHMRLARMMLPALFPAA